MNARIKRFNTTGETITYGNTVMLDGQELTAQRTAVRPALVCDIESGVAEVIEIAGTLSSAEGDIVGVYRECGKTDDDDNLLEEWVEIWTGNLIGIFPTTIKAEFVAALVNSQGGFQLAAAALGKS